VTTDRGTLASRIWSRSTPACRYARLARYLEVLRRLLAAIFNNFVLDHLPFIEGTQARTFNRRDMNEHVLASAALRLNEAIIFAN
jgi:hypothetical protein